MDGSRFDAISRRLAILAPGIAGAAGAASAQASQDATPVPDEIPADPHPAADGPSGSPAFLFVQPFAGGTWSPKDDAKGTYTLTLTGAQTQTVYFSDRPDRIFGHVATADFLSNLGFTPEDPPNAALVADGGSNQEVLIVELLNPEYDEAAGTLTYDARILADGSGPGLAHAARHQTDYALPESFDAGGLFIDSWIEDCASATYYCFGGNTGEYIGSVEVGQCQQGSNIFDCDDCYSPEGTCASKYPRECLYQQRDSNGNVIEIAYLCDVSVREPNEAPKYGS